MRAGERMIDKIYYIDRHGQVTLQDPDEAEQ